MKLRDTNDAAKAVVRIDQGSDEIFTPQQIAAIRDWIDQYPRLTSRKTLLSLVRALAFSHEHLRTDKVIELQQL